MNSGSTHQRLESLAMGITDEVAIDWSRETADRDHLRAMQLIQEVFQAHHALETPPDPADPPLFRWGSLEVRERVAEGGFGEVYRAFDPRLQRTLALKLRKEDAGTDRQWIEEARSLARVRHPNVLVVHDAAVHDDRAGIATEWVEGPTLETWSEQHGPVDADELRSLGRDLCRALDAVHTAGLAHGDVKAANVMRDPSGRLVLMDFGSSHRGTATGTPLYAAPERLDGAAATPAADLFSACALLYRLAAGRDPFPATTLEELHTAHRAGAVPLRELRPDLPRDLTAAIMAGLASDPVARPDSAARLEKTLQARPSRRGRWTALAAMAAAALAVLAWTWWTPAGFVDVQRAELLRVRGGVDHPLAAHQSLAVGDHLALRFAAEEPLHVYVLNEDAAGETYLLFPAPHSDLANPLEGGESHRLPGTARGESFDWVVTSAGGTETFLVVASREPVARLEDQVAQLRSVDPDRAPAYAQVAESTVRSLRGIGGMAPTSDSGPRDAGRLAALAAELQGPLADEDIWVRVWTVEGR